MFLVVGDLNLMRLASACVRICICGMHVCGCVGVYVFLLEFPGACKVGLQSNN